MSHEQYLQIYKEQDQVKTRSKSLVDSSWFRSFMKHSLKTPITTWRKFFSQSKWRKAAEVTLGAALERKFMSSYTKTSVTCLSLCSRWNYAEHADYYRHALTDAAAVRFIQIHYKRPELIIALSWSQYDMVYRPALAWIPLNDARGVQRIRSLLRAFT